MEARNRPLKDWMSKIRTRQLALPRFQRYEAWGPNLIEDCLTNVIRDLPIGSTLVLGVGDDLPFISREIKSAPSDGDKINELLLDGQQRLTAIWRCLNETYLDRNFMVYLPKGEEGDEPYVSYQTRWNKNDQNFPLWVDQPHECWVRNTFPVNLLNPDDEITYKNWAKIASNGDKDTEIEIRDIISSLRAKVANFQIPFLYLEPRTKKHVAIEVFIKLNTRYVSLTAFDIVVAQIEEATGKSLHDLVETITGNIPELINYEYPSDLVLPSAALLQDKQPNERGYLSLDFPRIVDDWQIIVKGMRDLVEFLKEEMVIDWWRLPTTTILPLITAIFAENDGSPHEKGNLRILLRKYLWRAFFTNRYDRAVPTAILQDYRAIKKFIAGEIVEKEIPCFDEINHPIPNYDNKDMLLKARWPKYKDRLARAILLLSLRGGAEDIADSTRISAITVKAREYHHLYPIAWLKQEGIEESEAYRALNCILVSWKTNRQISAKEPVKYLVESCEASVLGEDEIRRRLKTHFIDFDLLAAGNYAEFLQERADDCLDAINNLCKGHAWKP